MAISVDFASVVQNLTNIGYTALGANYQKLIDLGASFTADFQTVTIVHPDFTKFSYTLTMPSSLTTITKNANNKAVVTPFVTTLHNHFNAWVNELTEAKKGTVKVGKNTAEFKEKVSLEGKKVPDISGTVKMGYDLGNGKNENQEAAKSVVSEPKASKSFLGAKTGTGLFVDKGSFPVDVDCQNNEKLSKAIDLMQPVKGTSEGSTYYLIGMGLTELGKQVKVALRLTSPIHTDYKASMRLEGDGVKDITPALLEQGFTCAEDYASMHYTLDKQSVLRAVVAIMYTLPIQFTTTAKVY